MNIKKKLPLVSIIVPVYNTEKYLEKCILSLQNQTYRELEIILVDDGSSDDSARICDIFSQNDKRIKTIHKKNEGVTYARKTGFSNASGEYIMIVDSDDWIDLDTIEVCVNNALRYNADCVMFAYIREYGAKSIPNYIFDKNLKFDCNKAEEKIHRRLIGPLKTELNHPEKLDSLSSMCMKLYKIDIAKKGKFVSEREVGTSEDTIFNLYALEGVDSIVYINRCLYHYRKDNDKSITTHYKPGLYKKWNIQYDYFKRYIEKHNSEKYISAFYNRVACGMIGLGLNEVSSSKKIYYKAKDIAYILKQDLYKQAFRKIEIRYCPMKWKIFFISCRANLSFLVTILLLLMNKLRSRIG